MGGKKDEKIQPGRIVVNNKGENFKVGIRRSEDSYEAKYVLKKDNQIVFENPNWDDYKLVE